MKYLFGVNLRSGVTACKTVASIFIIFLLSMMFFLSFSIPAYAEDNAKPGLPDDARVNNNHRQEVTRSVNLYSSANGPVNIEIGTVAAETKEKGYRLKHVGFAYEVYYGEEPKNEFFEFRANGRAVTLGIDLSANGLEPTSKKQLKTEKNKVKYEEFLPDVDFIYTPLQSGIKEEIVLKKPEATGKLTWNMKNEGAAYEMGNDGSVIFKSEAGEPVFRFLKPFMVDAAGVRSESASLSVEDVGGTLKLKLDIDDNWVKAPERVFPVVIDPTVILEQDPSSGMDTYITESAGTQGTNFGYTDRLVVGRVANGGVVTKERSLIKFNLSSLPKGLGVIESAVLHLYTIPGSQTSASVVAYPLNQAWLEREASWSEAQKGKTWMTAGGSFNLSNGISSASSQSGEVTLDVRSLVERWVNGGMVGIGGMANDGILLMLQDEVTATTQEFLFASSDYPDYQLRPRLEVTYTEDQEPPDYVDIYVLDNPDGTKSIWVEVIDDGGPARAELYLDGGLLAVLDDKYLLAGLPNDKLYEYILDPTTLENGTHKITAKGYDLAGNSSEINSVSLLKDSFVDMAKVDTGKSNVNVDNEKGAVNLYKTSDVAISGITASSVKNDP
ncbi:MAG: DNRLRE domain-containing protein, partial [Bacillota bacterium]